MKFLLDTNAVIALLRGHPGLRTRLLRHKPQDFGIPAIVFHELFYGACKSQRREENLSRIEALEFECIVFDQDDARRTGKIRADLEASGAPIGPYDILIAGQALARNLVLITRNTREFRRVRGLAIEDWES